MSTVKLVALGVAWVLAALAVAVVTAIVLTELLRVVGVVEAGGSSYAIALNGVAVVVFVVLVSVPILFRKRFTDD
ncbi:MAG: hypothetical protein QGM46_07610 [Actinomycetota bacterium]|nr:hypothetical protein [Actinomycetota bacterium]MDK1016804.1 hypothetical protein [Actinomycetota bacterium]MDK1026727.1 hypothetical protein [Actinomycetota bacterium]MDK1097447.1 hypothetical protein [Actinomycetota bacterium]MDK1292195.1 hypothetical protein [Actinomycetota bacterium]